MAGGGYTFSQVPMADIPRSSFNRSHGHKTTFDAGYLVPIFVDEALPGDTFNVHSSIFARLATPIAPIMDNLHMEMFYFAVPHRLVWDNWQKFCGEQENPGDSTDFTVPVIDAGATGFPLLSIFDYFGIPCSVPNLQVNALFARAYNLIYNEWFRDENLCTRAYMNKGDTTDAPSNFPLRKRGKRHDYFTACLPWPQKGPGVELPIGSTAPVVPSGAGSRPYFLSELDAKIAPLGISGGGVTPVSFDNAGGAAGAQQLLWNTSGLVADLAGATAATINKLREAFQIQKLLERDARGGTRYIEILKSHFGVTSPDYRLQRPEFLGGGHIPVTINPIAQTSATGTYAATPQGNLSAYGLAAGRDVGFTKSFVEHSVIIGLVCVRADLSYQQGLPRMFSRSTRYDYYWPAFAHLGEQAVLNKEIYAQAPSVIDPGTGQPANESVFGYQERWAEYRYFPSKITGKFRSGIAGGSLDYWHLAQEFTALPTLSQSFIEENPPVNRIIAVQTEPQFIFDSHFKMHTTRPMPTYSVPGLIDHF
ncbi:MAG: major capsid protein [Microviridae sp.]|nr:MAG: major capsid protein [Microviridae sp.]